MVERYFPIDEYEQRWRRLEAEMQRRGIDVAVVWGRTSGTFDRSADITYLANYYSTTADEMDTPLWNARGFAALICQVGRMPELHTDEALHRFDLIATDRREFIGNRPGSHFDVIASVAAALGRRKVGGPVALVGSEFLSVKHARQLEERTPGIQWMAQDTLVQAIRRIKSPRELDCYREAGEIATRTSTLIMEGLIAGRSQAEAAAEGVTSAIRSGGWLIRTYLTHGSSVTDLVNEPMYAFCMERPQPGDLVRAACFGPWRQGYYMDPIRTAVCGGKPSADQRRLIETCIAIVQAMLAAIRPGVPLKDVIAIAERLRDQAGYDLGVVGEMWPSCWGHGLGLFWEEPWLIGKLCGDSEVFEEGMVMGVEAFLSAPGVGISGIEDNFIVTQSRTEVLTRMPMTWW